MAGCVYVLKEHGSNTSATRPLTPKHLPGCFTTPLRGPPQTQFLGKDYRKDPFWVGVEGGDGVWGLQAEKSSMLDSLAVSRE